MPIHDQASPSARRKAPGGCRASHLFLMINETVYAVHPLGRQSVAAERGFRLNKADGTLYDVAQTRHGPHCDCPDFVFRRDGIDPAGCKHVQALVAHGLIAGHAGAPGVPR